MKVLIWFDVCTKCRSVRRSTEPFGGIQLIICGDFLQLPPVSKGKEKASFCFQVRQAVFVPGLYFFTAQPGALFDLPQCLNTFCFCLHLCFSGPLLA